MPENIQKIIKNILRDIQVELTDEFDRNFERQAFFWFEYHLNPNRFKLSALSTKANVQTSASTVFGMSTRDSRPPILKELLEICSIMDWSNQTD